MASEMARKAGANYLASIAGADDETWATVHAIGCGQMDHSSIVQAFARFEAAIRADQVERDAKVAALWKQRWAEDHKRFDDQFWDAGAAVAEQIENDIRQKGSGHEG